MLRPTVPADIPLLTALASGTGVFKPLEIVALREVLEDYFAGEIENGHFAFTREDAGRPVAFAYYAPAYMTEHSWYLYWIAVGRDCQGRGLGAEVLRSVEAHVAELNGRILFIETSSLPHYEPTRRFYLKAGYELTGVVREFYADGDDMVVFRKRLRG